LIYGNTSTSVDKVLLSEGPLDYNFTCWSYSDPAVDYLALNASKVKIPTCLMVGVNTVDWGNYTDENEHFYGNLTVTKEFHYFTDTACPNRYPSVDTIHELSHEDIVRMYFGLGKDYTEVINDFALNQPYAWENFTTGLDPDSYSIITQDPPEWYNISIPLEHYSGSWTVLKRCPGNTDILICLAGGPPGESEGMQLNYFEALSYNLTVVTNTHTLYWGSYHGGYTGCDDLDTVTNLLKAQYSNVYYFGLSSGVLGLASQLIYGTSSANVTKAVLGAGPLNSDFGPAWGVLFMNALANNASLVSVPTSLAVGCNDMQLGNITQQNIDFYANLSVTKEIHFFADGHDIFSYSEISTNKTIHQIVSEFIYPGGSVSGVPELGRWSAYTKRVGCDAWGDSIARQGLYPHWPSYCMDWQNKIAKPLLNFPYIPADIADNEIIFETRAKHSAPAYYDNWPLPWVAPCPTIGATVMFYFNVLVRELSTGQIRFMFNFFEPDPFGGPDMFILEVFLTRWVVDPFGPDFWSCPPGYWMFEQWFTRTSHDNDLHLLTLPFEMPENDIWYDFSYDLAPKLRWAKSLIEVWSSQGGEQLPTIEVLGFQLYTVALGSETIGGSWSFDVDYLKVKDYRWGPGDSFSNNIVRPMKTNTDGFQHVPFLEQHWGYPRMLRPYMTYTNPYLEADINCDGKIDIYDVAILGGRFGSYEATFPGYTGPPYDYCCDLIKNRIIDIYDFVKLAGYYGETGEFDFAGHFDLWMVESTSVHGDYGYDPPPFTYNYLEYPRWQPYTVHYYFYAWDVVEWQLGTYGYINPLWDDVQIRYFKQAVFHDYESGLPSGVVMLGHQNWQYP